MSGNKTHAHQQAQIREGEASQDWRSDGPRVTDAASPSAGQPPPAEEKRQTDAPLGISQGGMNQESDHNKHNDPGQTGHKPQKHTPAEEKQH